MTENDNCGRYISERLQDQLEYFDSKALESQKKYRMLKKTAIASNLLTSLSIALAFALPNLVVPFGILAMTCSILVLGTYQIEEFQSYGAKWEKFRLVAEQIKSEKWKFLTQTTPYIHDAQCNCTLLVERIEKLINGTDINYFSLMVEPGKRLEKRMNGNEL